jgi:hypothetical protein
MTNQEPQPKQEEFEEYKEREPADHGFAGRLEVSQFNRLAIETSGQGIAFPSKRCSPLSLLAPFNLSATFCRADG